jgi:hypothetical protein
MRSGKDEMLALVRITASGHGVVAVSRYKYLIEHHLMGEGYTYSKKTGTYIYRSGGDMISMKEKAEYVIETIDVIS